MLTHRTKISSENDQFALQLVRNKVGRRVNPVHRLDRKTSGVLVFTFDSEITKNLQEQFASDCVVKRYNAIVRGFFPEKVVVDRPVVNARNKMKDAVTHFRNLKHLEIDLPFGKHPTSRYSLIEAMPKTGRMHQIRRHCNHLRHPIIGDRPHGCSKQNRLFKEKWDLRVMLLHAVELNLAHPLSGEKIVIRAPFTSEYVRIREDLEGKSIC